MHVMMEGGVFCKVDATMRHQTSGKKLRDSMPATGQRRRVFDEVTKATGGMVSVGCTTCVYCVCLELLYSR